MVLAQTGDREAQLISLPELEKRPITEKHFFGTKLTVNVAVDSEGNVTEVYSVEGPGSTCPGINVPEVIAIRKAAKVIATNAKFEPAIVSGQKTNSRAVLEIEFPTMAKALPMREVEKTSDSSGSQSGMREVVKTKPSDHSVGGNPSKPARDKDTAATNAGAVFAEPRGSYSSGARISGSGNEDRDTVSVGILNGRAITLAKPNYPAAARAVRASGAVAVQVMVDEDGVLMSATPVSGHPLLQSASRIAACSSKFSPTMLSGRPVKVTGVITYNFVP